MIILDIETCAAPDDVLALGMPSFDGPANYVDPVKIAKAIEEKRQAWKDRAALSPLTGRILAIGLLGDDGERILTGTEASMLECVWEAWSDGSRFVGFNVKFDFRFLAVRSWALGVQVPDDLMEGRYFNRRIVCLQEIVTFYSKEVSGYSLAATCAAFGLPGKLPGLTGADFARIFAEDRERALAYLRADLAATAALAQRLGIT